MSVFKKCWLWALVTSILVACMATVWVFIHRRAIRAAVKGDAMPACPHWLPDFIKETLAAK